MLKKKFVLGSANFSKGYGIKKGKGISLLQLNKIAQVLKKNNINFVDTALSYPGVEKKIALSKLKNFEVYTKILKNDLKNKSSSQTTYLFLSSLNTLKKKSFHTVYFHKAKDLLEQDGENFYNNIVHLKKINLTKKIGISVYSPEELKKLLKKYSFDVIQIPLNVFDRRFLKHNFLNRLKKKGIEIHVRSIFLQGILLLESKKVPKYFKRWSKLFKDWDNWNLENNQNKLSTCINFIKSIKHVDKVILGISNYNQINEIINCCQSNKTKYPKKIFSKSKNLVDPRLWPK